MKLSLTLTALLAALDSASGRVAATEKIMKNARRLDYNYHYANGGYSAGYAYEEGKEGAFLQGYSLKMMSCLKGEKSYNYQEKTTEFNTVIFRLCPVDTCSNSTSTPCDEGFGDFAVGLNTFAEAYVESIKDNYNNGYDNGYNNGNNNGMTYYSYDYGEINMEEYVRECKLWEEEGQDNENYNAYGTYAYIGATCTDDGTDIKLASFSDPYCTEESEDSFADTHNGFELPYSSGGLAPDDCVSCMSMNDNYEYELNEMCLQLYESATYKCEENMEFYNAYYGPDTRGCDYLYDYVPKASKKKKSSSSNKSSSADSGNFFTNQSEDAKMAEELVAVLIISALIGAVVVAAFTQDRISKMKETSDEESEEAPSKVESVVESMKSGAMLVKLSALGLAATIAAKLRPSTPEPEPEGEYLDMDTTKKGPENDEC